MKILVLDDDEVRHEGFTRLLHLHDVFHVYTVEGAITSLISDGPFDAVFLDHDLNDLDHVSRMKGESGVSIELTGLDVASFIANILAESKRPAVAIVHSWNPAGAQRMVETLRDKNIKVCRWTYGTDTRNLPVTLSSEGRI